jgi:hypothetical protein
LADVSVGAILTPVHKCQKQAVFETVLGLAPAPGKLRPQSRTHVEESRRRYPGQTLKETRRLGFEIGIEHNQSILQLRKRSIVYGDHFDDRR